MVKASKDDPQPNVTIIDTLQSLLIAFILAFTFRAFVVEAFVIPTGSMAPTLLGAHASVTGPDTGYVHTVGPIDDDSPGGMARPALGTKRPYQVSDPMLDSTRAQEVRLAGARTRMGDRILVLKYLYTLFGPTRYDVVVFKNPTDPTENYIKRLIGLPNETIWLADGDVFAKRNDEDQSRFAIQRKPIHIQRAVWQPVYHSDFIPIKPDRITPRWTPPWCGANADDWSVENTRTYECNTDQPTALVYQYAMHPITDTMPYNEPREGDPRRYPHYPVSDIRLFGVIRPRQAGLSTTIHLECCENAFEAKIADGQAVLQMRSLTDENAQWDVLDTKQLGSFAPAEHLTEIEFWHVDQALYLWINRELVAQAKYDWSPAQRLELATGLSVERAVQIGGGNPYHAFDHPPRPASLRWEFAGSPLSLHRVELDRDLYYRPDDDHKSGLPALATFPGYLPELNGDQFFCCGDNNPASLDGRLWGKPDPWVAAQIDPAPGVVNRALLLGKAFFVYFPSPEGLRHNARRFIPNFGAMRFIH